MRSTISIITGLMLVFSILPGCASKYGTQNTMVNYYPACYAPISDLRAREHNVGEGTATGAFLGAMGGALLGLLAGGGKWQGAAVGAATGAVTGTMMGNAYAQRQQQIDDNRHMAAYLENIDGDISNLDLAGAAARNSLQCYDRQFDVLLKQIRARTITRQEASLRFAEISSGREEAISILGHTAAYGRNMAQQYEDAFAQEEQAPGARGVKKSGATRKARQTVDAAKSRQRVLQHKAKSMDEEIVAAQSNTAKQNREMNAELGKIYENAIDARI